MVAWEQKTFVFPEPWGLTPPKCKGSCLLSDPHHGSPHKVLGMSILKHFLLLLSPSLLGDRPSRSLQRPLRASAPALGAPGRVCGELPTIYLRKSQLSGPRCHITEQLPSIVRLTLSSQHPRGFHGNYFRIIISILQG